MLSIKVLIISQCDTYPWELGMLHVRSIVIIQDEGCYTALEVACGKGHVNVAVTLINNGAAVNYQS